MILQATPLLARGRDDVLAGMFRCAAIGETRIWLDCYYGAAQPLRAALGLKPASPDQVRLSQQPPAVSAPAGTDLGPRYQATSGALRCNNYSDDRQWLDCYYGAAQPVRSQLGLSPAPRMQADMSTAGGTLPSPGGVSQPLRQGAPAVDRSATALSVPNSGWLQMTSYNFNRYGIFTLSLANGQRWRQLSGDTSLAHWTKPPSHYWVRITRGALRSLNLKIRGEAAAYKVEPFD